MRRQDFHFGLPKELIAQYPPESRDASRLLCLNGSTGDYSDRFFTELPGLLSSGDLLIFNDTRVIPARVFGKKETGGKVEILIERVLDEYRCLAQIRASKSPKPGSRIVLEDNKRLELEDRENEFFILRTVDDVSINTVLEQNGHIPLPPYIQRADEIVDYDRYQTVFARHAGAVAAPTAGLHFSESMLEVLKDRGIATGFVTLHVGAGTFQPVRVTEITEHKMHKERFNIERELCEQIKQTREQGGRIIAVGTTTVRTLEAAVSDGCLQAGTGETDIFIYPGYEFQLVDAMITNFHLPESTLLMLVCAFAGIDNVLQAYQHAVEEQYRFFSYGDAMFIE